MKKTNTLLTLFILVSFPLSAFSRDDNDIVGGEHVKDMSEAPFAAKLDHCTGSIIAPSWILTAGHCLESSKTARVNFENPSGKGVEYQVDENILHPLYTEVPDLKKPLPEDMSDRMRRRANRQIQRQVRRHELDTLPIYDFALLHLATPIDLSQKNVKKIDLATPEWEAEKKDAPGIMATVYGWGVVGTGTGETTLNKTLHKVQLPIVSTEVANAKVSYGGKVLAESMIAAGYYQGGKGFCYGDSGGPLVVRDAVTQVPVLVGVVSWSDGCARNHKYDVYARASAAYEWIKKTLADHGTPL